MPSLSRKTRPLLRQVDNKPHATYDDHEPGVASRESSPLSDLPRDADTEDYSGEPDSASSDDDTSRKSAVSEKASPFFKSNKSRAKDATSSSLKRKADIQEPFSQPDWMSQSQQSKRAKTGGVKYGSSQRSNGDAFKRPAFGLEATKAKPVSKTFRRPRETAEISSTPAQSEPHSSQSSFLRPSAAAEWEQLKTTKHVATHDLTSLPSSPPELRSPTPEIEEVYLDGTNPAEYEPCQICGESVAKSYVSEWQIQHCHGKRMNLRKQQEFCKAHKLDGAESAWHKHGYPEIDWSELTGRLIRLKPRIERILEGKGKSFFRDDFEMAVRKTDSRTLVKVFDTGALGMRTGYYGGRGAKAMAAFATTNFNDKLLRLSSSDKLVATSSVAGGISGFVHGVVVPELALALIMEDMDADEERAMRVLDESTALGNTLHPEQEDDVPVRATLLTLDGTADATPVVRQKA